MLILFQTFAQPDTREKFFPNLTVIGSDRQEIGDASGFGFRMKCRRREPQTADDADRAKEIKPVF